MIKVGILTISDRASSGIYEDLGGPEIKRILKDWILNDIEFFYEIIPDEFEKIEEKLIKFCDELKCDMIFTTGGTGPAKRDITPEVTTEICDKILPGFGELMRMESLKFVPTAILSRQTAGVRKNSLVVNLPGQPKAILQCLKPIFSAIPYCIDLIGGNFIKTDETKIKAFRPKK